MRKLKLLMLAFMATCWLGASAASYVIDQRFSNLTDLDGQKFAIVNENEAKAFYGINNQNLGYNDYSTAFAATNTATSFRLVAATGSGVEGCYYLQAVKPDGTDYFYNGGGYLNAQPAEWGWCCFILGLNNQNGQDFLNGAVWELAINNGTFAIKNKGTGLYLKNAGNATSADPVYFTLCTMKEDLLASKKQDYDALKAKYQGVYPDLNTSEADALLTNATTIEDVQAAISKLLSIFEVYMASVEGETNMTSFITNPSFETGNTTGWTYEGSNDAGAKANSNGTYTIDNADGNYVFNIWSSGNLISQTIENLPNGNYKMMALIATDADHQVILSANGISTTVESYGGNDSKGHGVDGTVEFTVLNNTATIGAEGANKYWYKVDNFRLFYTGPIADLTPYAESLAEAVSNATINEGTIPAAAYNALQNVLTEYNKEWNTANEYNTAIEAVNAAGATAKAFVAPYSAWNKLKTSANAIAAVEYTETASDSHNIFTDAISTQTENVENATSTETIETAITTIIAAIKTYIAGAEPKNDGEYFDITCLMTNPNFDDSHNGWTKNIDPGVNWSNCEYYEKEFDINQTVTGLPTGSYSLSVQAFQRPGWAGDVYTDYVNGTDNASSVLYINSITSNVKNIAADAQSTGKLGDDSNWGSWPNDSRVGSEGNYKYVPNSQQGANLYFGAGLYDATCAAVVTDEDGGSLKLGFKSTKTHVGGDWTIFDNFRLYYYGSSLLVYYKQYLPQLKSEASADLANGAYANVTGKEKADFEAALAATPDAETEAAYKTVIDNITTKQTAFREAAPAYDALVAAKAEAKLEKITANIGNGVFQYDATTNDNLYTDYETAYNTMMATSAVYSENPFATAENINTALGMYNNRKNAYQNLELNAPVEGMKYNIVVATEGHAKAGNAIVIVPGATSENNPTGYGLNANFAPNANLAQAVTFTKVSGNKYNISFETAEGTAYLTYGKTNGSAAGWADSQIQATTDADKKGVFTIVATTTDNVFNIVNNITNTKIDCQNGGNIYTDEGITLDGFSVAEASEASVSITIDANVKLATRIFPFTATLPEGVKAFSCNGVNEGELELTEVETLEANVPYILYVKEGYDGALTGWGTATDTKYTEGLLTGVYVTTPAPVGSWVLQNQDGDVSFYKVGENQPTVGANRAYLTYEGQSPARLSFPFEDELTAINAIKAMTSGKVEIFNVSGAKLPALQKGMNILKTNDGRSLKVMVK